MLIQSIKQITKYSFKILTEENCFVLSFRNLHKYGIEEGGDLSVETYEEIKKECLLPSAKRKAMDLLLKMDQSEKELRRKLSLKHYPSEVVDEAISYVKKFNYINDERYAKNYVSYRSSGKSKKQVKMELQRKGIEKEKAEELILENIDEEEAIDKLIKKKLGSKTEFDQAEMRKLMAYLYRRGFETELIQSKLREFYKNFEES